MKDKVSIYFLKVYLKTFFNEQSVILFARIKNDWFPQDIMKYHPEFQNSKSDSKVRASCFKKKKNMFFLFPLSCYCLVVSSLLNLTILFSLSLAHLYHHIFYRTFLYTTRCNLFFELPFSLSSLLEVFSVFII